MNIHSTRYTHATRSFDIYVSGCSATPKCEGCHNPTLWDFGAGEEYTEEYFRGKIKPKVTEFKEMIKQVVVYGGDLLDQDESDALSFMLDLKLLNKPIVVFTRHDIRAVPEWLKVLCDYIKCGEYLPRLSSDNHIIHGFKLATTNQTVYKKGEDY